MNKLKSNILKGFTLVEMIVVLVVLSVILAISVPAVTGYINDAKDAQSKAECASVVKAAQPLYVKYYTEGVTSLVKLNQQDVYQNIMNKTDANGNIINITSIKKNNDITELLYRCENGTYVLYYRDYASNDKYGEAYNIVTDLSYNTETEFSINTTDGNKITFTSIGDIEKLVANANVSSKNPYVVKKGTMLYYRGKYHYVTKDFTISNVDKMADPVKWYSRQIDLMTDIGYYDLSTKTKIEGTKITQGGIYWVDYDGDGTFELSYNCSDSVYAPGQTVNSWAERQPGYWRVIDGYTTTRN